MGELLLEEFIARAKKGTYASDDGVQKNPRLEGSKELTYRAGIYFYRDIYFGSRFFNGIETVYINGKPTWGMTYSGGITDPDMDEGKVYDFLKKCLYLVDEEAPFRGPKSFSDNDFYYTNQFQGEIDHFMGYETIEIDETTVYELHYSGGTLYP
ncbi:MAG: DUF5680 domain-containing protein [Candidatus Thermoplasmatota archaeon]|jgi:hypothetical protein|nr:DUF5680 domain-containing protein [Candidatus Thermoplasmatota archaeon]MCL5988515.1 DUF5680 domain-containing protein [Candidatus Thermoplasmatota archaeon]